MIPKKKKLNLDDETYLDFTFKGINLRARSITITEEIDYKWFIKVDAAMSEFEAQSSKPVTIKISSQGGNVYDALAIVGRLKRSKCMIVTEGYGSIMSAATLILASGNTRKISKLAWFMTHESTYEVEGRHSNIAATVAQYEREDDQWCQWMSTFTGKEVSFWKENGRGVDAYFTPDQLVELGVVDAVI